MNAQMTHDTIQKRSSREWLWVPLLCFFRGMVLVSLLSVTMVMLKRMGMSNTMATASTACLALPWVLRHLLRRVICAGGSRWLWIVLTQAVFALSIWGVALTLQPNSGGSVIWVFLVLGALSGGLHDVAASDLSRSWIDRRGSSLVGKESPSFGSRQVIGLSFFLLAVMVGLGLVLIMAGDMEVLSRSLDDSWGTTFEALALCLVGLSVLDALVLPRDVDGDGTCLNPKGKWSLEEIMAWWRQPLQWVFAALVVLFTLHEWMLWRGTLLFLVDPGSIGGLSLGPQEVGFVQGTVSVLAMMMGCVLGLEAARKWGVGKSLLPMALLGTLPDVLLLYLAFRMPSDLPTVSLCLATEAFGCGFAVACFILYIRYNSPGKDHAAHFDICFALVMLSSMIGGWCTGLFQDYLGYRRFFMIVAALAVLALVAVVVAHLLYKKCNSTFSS